MEKFDLVVIGGGPGGYTAAIRAAQLGLRTACIEKEPLCGGTCLRVGCIPSKVLLESTEKYVEVCSDLGDHGITVSNVSFNLSALMARKSNVVKTLARGIDGLLKKNGVTRYRGVGKLQGAGRVLVRGEDNLELTADHVLLATGSIPATLPGIELDGEHIVSSTEALSFSEVPEHLVVIGAGYIGLELGSVWARLGARVTVLEYLPRILPGTDEEIAAEGMRLLSRKGIEFHLNSKVLSAQFDGTACVIEIEGADAVSCDKVLVAVGRKPYTEELGLDTVGIALDEKGRIPIDEGFQTPVRGIYAVGDLVCGPMLAHKAEEEGIACVEKIVEGYGEVNYDAIPSVCYTSPEIASVGKTEEALIHAGIAYSKGVFPFVANGRAHTLGVTEGRVKVLADANTDRVLGVHIIGPRAGDLIAEASAAMAFGASSEDIARTCHAHPTLSEALKEAALSVLKRAIHI